MHHSLSSRLPLLLAVAACLLLLGCTRTESAKQTTSAPDSDKLVAALEGYADIVSDFDQLRAVVIATDDGIVFEQYYDAGQDASWGMQSVTKSVVSTLIGIALDEGLIASLDDTLAQLLPGYADDMTPAVAGTTLRQLLTMTAGFPSGGEGAGPAFIQSEDWVREILMHPETPPGGDFVYSNGTAHLLAAVLEEAAGTSALGFARSRLFDPLGIDTRPAFRGSEKLSPEDYWTAYENADFAWPVDPRGVSTGWWGLKLKPVDMVKLGQLFLADGRWGDTQVVPADWVAQATTQQVAADGPSDGYGYQWWTGTVDGDEFFAALGYGGQIIEVVPDRDLVVVTATELRQTDATSHGIDVDVLLSVIEDGVLPLAGD